MQTSVGYIEAELETAAFRPTSTTPPSVGQFERLPKWLNCIPLVTQWLWLSLKYGSVSLPSCANPHITCGGMVGEGKREYFECMGPLAKSKTAKYITLFVNQSMSIQGALEKMEQDKLYFPIVVKPDIGWCGYGVRLIKDSIALETYICAFPHGETMHMQQYIPHVGEAGLFYVRHPDEPKGRLISITLRHFPQVIGDGIHNIARLMAQDTRLSRVKNSKLHQPDFDPAVIPARGEAVRLSTIGSTRTGGLYCDGGEHITKALEDAVDAIARDMKNTYPPWCTQPNYEKHEGGRKNRTCKQACIPYGGVIHQRIGGHPDEAQGDTYERDGRNARDIRNSLSYAGIDFIPPGAQGNRGKAERIGKCVARRSGQNRHLPCQL